MSRNQLWSELKSLGNPQNLRYNDLNTARLAAELHRLNVEQARQIARALHGLDDEEDDDEDFGIALMLDQAAATPRDEIKFYEAADMKTRIYYVNGLSLGLAIPK